MKCSIQVLVFVVNLVMAVAMSIDELEDFSNFLKDTSLLDQPLKKNPTVGDEDDVPISDHAWEDSGRFEGDLILNDRQRQLIVQDIAEGLSRNGLKDSTKRWPNNEVIFYIQKEHFTGDQVQAILSGIEELSQASCVKFRPYRKGDRDAVVVQGSRRGCFSQVGYQGGYQVLNLSGRHPVGRGCFRHGTVVHEFLHTLGFYHMQSSPDRDDYIDVIWENIVQPARHNFRKYNLFSVSDFGVGYDYDSVLHYSRKAFSSNGGDTLVPKQSGVQIGQRVGLSEKDSSKLNKMYCDSDSNNFEAADDVPHTLVIKKKKTPNNKPFEGHGIGYQQGKTVVFKLPPAETYSEKPSIPVFDYFSKAPQALPPTLIEGIGVGQKISYSSKLPSGFQIVEHKIPTYRYPTSFSTTRNAEKPTIRQHNTQNINVEKKPPNADVNTSSKNVESREEVDERAIPILHTSKKTDTINRKIYSNVYKPNTDYSEFYNPVNNYDIGTKTDFYLNYSPSLKGKHDQENTELISNLKLTRQFIEKLNVPKSINADSIINKQRQRLQQHELYDNRHETAERSKTITTEKPTSGDIDSPFGYVKPSTKLKEIRSIYFLNPEYTSKKYLENKHDFSSLYYPSDNLNKDPESRTAQYRLFGELVPTNINYTSRGMKNDKKLYMLPANKMDDEQSKESVAYPSNIPTLFHKDVGNESNEYSYEPTSNEEKASKSYEVTEKILEPVALVTMQSNVESSESQDVETKLEKRLPDILERYVSYDNYDITSPIFEIREVL